MIKKVFRAICKTPSRILLAFIWFYRKAISPLFPPVCRFYPTCSHYSATAVSRFGLLKGGLLMIWRLLRCHPFYKGNLYDPVPPSKKNDRDNG